jgi:formate-dependent nitrite reductase cytochrome c552 subunit
MIQASGRAEYEAYFEGGVLKTAIVLGAGYIKKESCLACHDRDKDLKEVENKKLMHEKHVTVKTARCFDCHQPIVHKKTDLRQPVVAKAASGKSVSEKLMRGQFIRDSCTACHPEPHRFQRLLAAGHKRKGVSETPGFHFRVRATCMACHFERKVTDNGEIILRASAKACVGCHQGRKNLLKEWKKDLESMIKDTQEVEKEALAALTKVKAKLSKAKRAKVEEMLKEGRENFNLVRFGNGVHNKKYSMFVLDAAMVRFEDALEYLEEGE